MANEENRKRDEALWTDGNAATCTASAAEPGRAGANGAATAGAALAAKAGRMEPDGAAVADEGSAATANSDSAAEPGRAGADEAATADDDSAVAVGRMVPDGAATAGGDSAARCDERKHAARRGRGRSIRRLGAQMLQTPVEVSEEQREALNRLGVAKDESELQVLLLGRLATFALYGEPRLALQAVDKLLEIAGKDIRTLENDENRKIKHAELALSREKFESSTRSPEQSSLEKLDALIAGIDSIARDASPTPPEESGSEDAEGRP